jgi:hypothetical protein
MLSSEDPRRLEAFETNINSLKIPLIRRIFQPAKETRIVATCEGKVVGYAHAIRTTETEVARIANARERAMIVATVFGDCLTDYELKGQEGESAILRLCSTCLQERYGLRGTHEILFAIIFFASGIIGTYLAFARASLLQNSDKNRF